MPFEHLKESEKSIHTCTLQLQNPEYEFVSNWKSFFFKGLSILLDFDKDSKDTFTGKVQTLACFVLEKIKFSESSTFDT